MLSRSRLIVGLTGGIGSGKSLALAEFGRLGAKTIDLDEIAWRQARPGGAAYRALARGFGRAILDADRRIDRAKLAELVFKRPALRRRLESMTHPLILREMRRRVRQARGVVVVDVPLLFEGRHAGEFDLTMTVSAPRATRLRRLAARGLSRGEALRRMAAQLPDAAKAARADVVAPNAGPKKEFLRRVREYHKAFTLMQESPV